MTESSIPADFRTCKSCNGSGVQVRESFTYEGKTYPETRKVCYSCEGEGVFSPPNEAAICELIKGRKGLRSARPKDPRAYYVWRLARFHGGVDITMPVMAGLEVHGDPFVKELDEIADKVAAEYFGSNMHAAYRWGKALGAI